MTELNFTETEYNPDVRGEFRQLFTEEYSLALEELNETYAEGLYTDLAIERAAEELPRTESSTKGYSNPSLPETEDGYEWRAEVTRDSGALREYFKPIFDKKEIRVLFPRKTLIHEGASNISAKEWIMNKGFPEGDVEKMLDALYEDEGGVDTERSPYPERSINVYATDKVSEDEAEEFLRDLNEALE